MPCFKHSMADNRTPAQRSQTMRQIRSKDTGPEMQVRRYLHGCGFRYRLHPKNLPGRPDVVLPAYRTVIFVHGCFWHGHAGCRYAKQPAQNHDFWQTKLGANVMRDQRKAHELLELGWHVITVWECELKQDAPATLARLQATLQAQRQAVKSPAGS